jgi:hypothetical protein
LVESKESKNWKTSCVSAAYQVLFVAVLAVPGAEALQRRLLLLLLLLHAVGLRELRVDQVQVGEHLEVVDSLGRALVEALDSAPVDGREQDLLRSQEVLDLARLDVAVVVGVFVQEVVRHAGRAELVQVHLGEAGLRRGSA